MSTPTQHLTSTDIETMRDQLIMYKTHLEHEEDYDLGTVSGRYRPTHTELESYERFRMWIQAAVKALDNLVKAFDCDFRLMPTPAQIETFTPLDTYLSSIEARAKDKDDENDDC